MAQIILTSYNPHWEFEKFLTKLNIDGKLCDDHKRMLKIAFMYGVTEGIVAMGQAIEEKHPERALAELEEVNDYLEKESL